MVEDPVCGRLVNKQEALAKSQYKDQTYYFCSSTCRQAFETDPLRYIDPQAGQQSA